MSSASDDFRAVLHLTNQRMRMPDGRPIERQRLGLDWERTLDGDHLALYDVLRLRNLGVDRLVFAVSLRFQAHFEDLFVLRGERPGRRGRLHQPYWQKDTLTFRYDGADGLYHRLTVQFSLTPTIAPRTAENTTAHFEISLQAQESQELFVALRITESPNEADMRSRPERLPSRGDLHEFQQRTATRWLDGVVRLHSDSRLLDEVIDRSLRDLRMLRMPLGGESFIAAGAPWFVTLFGRDSLIATLQSLAFDPSSAAGLLRVLARHQGQQEDPRRHEQPGKIAHELRVGEMAHLNEIPQTPNYISVDAAPLFLILLARHAAWTGSLELFQELRGPIERALAWIDHFGAADHDSYVVYDSMADHEPLHQGWKDSGTAIVNKDGSLAKVPIALVEVQGYVYLAKQSIAELYRRSGEPERADRLMRDAQTLRERFNRDYWIESEGCYCMALEQEGRQVAVISSNPGHALWSGIADSDKAQATADRLMQDDIFSGWGVRTLSEREVRFNPIHYHLGSVWPHDNAVLAAGFRRYGLDPPALRIFSGILEAASCFGYYRLPEFFTGLRRETGTSPARCPMADPLHAWSSSSVPYLIETLLGLQPDAFNERLRIVRPVLPEFLEHIELHGLRVGQAIVNLRFERTADRLVSVKVLNLEGRLEIRTEGPA